MIVYTHSLATKILFDTDNDNDVTGTNVTVRSGRLYYTLHARRDIILSAGAFQSPQLLMVSGISPADVLREQNISVVVERKGVAQNRWDHIDIEATQAIDVIGTNSLKNTTLDNEQKAAYYELPSVSIYEN